MCQFVQDTGTIKIRLRTEKVVNTIYNIIALQFAKLLKYHEVID